MCTVTVVSHDRGFRLAFNRDERLDRAPGLAPAVHRLANRRAIFPVDPVGGGTWVGVNDVGLVAALLNGTPDATPRRPRRPLLSRGLIVPLVLDCVSPSAAVPIMRSLEPATFDRFRLLVIQRGVALVFASDGHHVFVETADLSSPLILTSSSLGDARVAAPRVRLFNAMMRAGRGARLRAQERFHDHQWPWRKEVSVRMERADARTVSQTVIDVGSGVVRLRYGAGHSDVRRAA
jgi:transport and Golgi organization protein 2